MLNKQRLHGWKDFVAFKAAYTRELKEAELAARKQRAAKAKALDENLMVAMKVFGILIVILGALFGVAIYVR